MTAFEHYCRRPGTRCNDIMTRIERGETDEAIGAIYEAQMEKQCDTAAVIHVYRMAMEGRISEGSADPTIIMVKASKAERETIHALRAAGKTIDQIAYMMGIKAGRVKHLLYNEQHKDRNHGRGKK